MKLRVLMVALPIAALGITLGACTPTPTPNSFSQAEAGTVMPVQYGTITALRQVDIRPNQTRLGTAAGAALGAIGGSQIGSSSAANVAGGVTGAVVGGAAGSAIQGSRNTPGLELHVRLDTEESIAIVQPGDPRDFRVGDRVRVTGTAENARVTR